PPPPGRREPDTRSRRDGPHGADLVKPRDAAAEDLPRLGRIELGRATAHPREGRKSKFVIAQERLPADREWRRHGELGGRELGGELMLLDDLRIRPAAWPIELEHQLPLTAAELADAVLVAVEGEQPPVRREPERGGGIEHHLG